MKYFAYIYNNFRGFLYELLYLWVGFKLRWFRWLLTLAYWRELIHSGSRRLHHFTFS